MNVFKIEKSYKSKVKYDKYSLFVNVYNYWVFLFRIKFDIVKIFRMD